MNLLTASFTFDQGFASIETALTDIFLYAIIYVINLIIIF